LYIYKDEQTVTPRQKRTRRNNATQKAMPSMKKGCSKAVIPTGEGETETKEVSDRILHPSNHLSFNFHENKILETAF
jgi:hypothetical protein